MTEHPLNILIADDDEEDIFLIKELLREGMSDPVEKIEYAKSFKDALALINKMPFDVCLFDFRLGDEDGIRLLKQVRDHGHNMPIVFLTGFGDQEIAVEAMKAGATDYLIKANLSEKVLSQSIRHAIKLSDEEKQRKRAEETLRLQGKLLEGVSEATKRLLTVPGHYESIIEALSVLAKATELDHACLFQHTESSEGAPAFVKFVSWSKVPETVPRDPVDSRCLTYEALGLSDTILQLKEGEIIQIEADGGHQALRNAFQANGYLRVIMVPIEVDGSFWGFMGFAKCTPEEQTWAPCLNSVLNVAAASIGGKIKRNRDEETFHSIVEGTSSRIGDEFFTSLVQHLANCLHVRYAYLSQIADKKSMESSIVAGWEEGKFITDFVYSVADTPCEDVLAGMIAYYPNDLQDLFPKDSYLKKINAHCFAGVPCFDSSSKVIGHLTVMDDKPMLEKDRTLSILKLFASRAGAELERKQSEEAIKNMAYHDALTGLPNRLLLNDRLAMGLAHSQRYNKIFAIMYIDFDGFKGINDTLGHAVGDQLLKGISERFRKALRREDTVARLGGDEFVIYLPEIRSKEDAGILAQKLLDVGRKPLKIESHELCITLSIGISVYPDHGQDLPTLIKRADEAMYLAKNEGRDCFKISEP